MHVYNSPEHHSNERPVLLALCLFFSVLLHILVIIALLYGKSSLTSQSAKVPQTTVVRLVEKPQPKEKIEYEIDQHPPETKDLQPIETRRLAEQKQRVAKEQAPKGEDFRDQQPIPKKAPTAARAPVTPSVPPAPAPAQPKPKPQPSASRLKASTTEPAEVQAPAQAKAEDEAPPAPKAAAEHPLPSLAQLTQLPPSTLARLETKGQEEKIKQRDEVEAGDTVWLNLEQGPLISFFRRFRNQIEGVWNYPQEAIRNEIEGVLQLKITVSRTGELLDVDLIKSSGSDLLDFEAIQAVYRAAPFGPLSKHYQYPDLKINAHFHYRLVGKYIYGR